MVQAGIADLASYRMKLSERPHVILFDHALRNLPEQDARCDQTSAALWALQFVQKNGLVLSLHHDRRPRKGSYGQLLRRSGEERGNMIPLVAEALQEGGRKVGLLHPALQYCAACPRSSSALRRIIAQHLPIGTGEQVYRNLAAQQFLSRNCGTGGQGSVFTHGFTILAAKN